MKFAFTLLLPILVQIISYNSEVQALHLYLDEKLFERVVVPLNETTVVRSDKTWFIYFYATWCQECKPLRKEWSNFGNQIERVNKEVLLGTVNCMENINTCARFDI